MCGMPSMSQIRYMSSTEIGKISSRDGTRETQVLPCRPSFTVCKTFVRDRNQCNPSSWGISALAGTLGTKQLCKTSFAHAFQSWFSYFKPHVSSNKPTVLLARSCQATAMPSTSNRHGIPLVWTRNLCDKSNAGQKNAEGHEPTKLHVQFTYRTIVQQSNKTPMPKP